MDGLGTLTAELAAWAATALAAIAAVPQLRRVIAHHDCCGVSVTSATLGTGTELAWVAYASSVELWSAIPEAVMMACANAVLVVALIRHGAIARAAARAGAAWIATLGGIVALGGVRLLAVVLGVSYVVQVAPAIWTAWTTPSPTGVATATWTMTGIEGLLWGTYGVHHTDPATACFAAIATLAASTMVVRKISVGWRTAPPKVTPARVIAAPVPGNTGRREQIMVTPGQTSMPPACGGHPGG